MVTICPGTQSESDSGIEESSEKISDLQNGDVSLQNPNNLLQHQVQNELTEKQLERYGVAIKEGLDNALAVIQNGNAVERSQTSGASSDDDNVSGTLSETSFQGGEMSLEPSLGHKPGTKHEVNAYDCNNFHVGDLVKNKVIVKCVVGTPNQESQESYSRESIENSQKKLGTITKAVAVGVSLTLILVVVTVALLVTQLGSSKGKSTCDDLPPVFSSRYIDRKNWFARSSKKTLHKFSTLPLSKVIIDTTGSFSCDDHFYCPNTVLEIQNRDIASGSVDDIKANFVLAEDGYIYEGRGWDYVGQNVPGQDEEALEVMIMGKFDDKFPTCSNASLPLLLDQGVIRGTLVPNYKIYGRQQFSEGGYWPNMKPDSPLVKDMEKWAKWSPLTMWTSWT